MYFVKVLAYIAFTLIELGSCYKILALFPIHIKSHFVTFEPLLKALSKRGHDLTVVSHFPQKMKIPNYKDKTLEETASLLINVINVNDFTGARYEKYLELLQLTAFQETICETFLQSKIVKEIMDSDEKYDLVLTEFFNTNCVLSVLDKIKAPVVGMSSCGVMPWFNSFFANPDNPSYIPNLILDNSNEMNFIRRVENTVVLLYTKAYYRIVLSQLGNAAAKRYIPSSHGNLDRYFYDSSLLLVNTHFSLHGAVPFVPNIIEVGGLHIGKLSPLPHVCNTF